MKTLLVVGVSVSVLGLGVGVAALGSRTEPKQPRTLPVVGSSPGAVSSPGPRETPDDPQVQPIKAPPTKAQQQFPPLSRGLAPNIGIPRVVRWDSLPPHVQRQYPELWAASKPVDVIRWVNGKPIVVGQNPPKLNNPWVWWPPTQP